VVNVEAENFSCIDDEWYDTSRNKNGYEQRRDRVKTCPPIKLNQERRDDDANRAQCILSKDLISFPRVISLATD
jgi:hypothetical protein